MCDCSQPLRSHRYVRPCSQGSLHSLYTIHKHTLTLARTRFRTLTLTFFLFSLFQSLYLFCVALILTCSLSLSVCSVSQSRTHFRMQALRIDFDMVSTSEINPDFRDFFMANGGGSFKHVHASIEEQLTCSEPCLLCAKAGEPCGAAAESEEPVDLLVTGSPCDPFSVYRAKRFASGSVKSHKDYDVTMSSVLDMYKKFEPHVGIFEQVLGFTQRLESGNSSASPYDRQGVFHDCCLCLGLERGEGCFSLSAMWDAGVGQCRRGCADIVTQWLLGPRSQVPPRSYVILCPTFCEVVGSSSVGPSRSFWLPNSETVWLLKLQSQPSELMRSAWPY